MDASKAAMDTSNAALAQLVLGLFTPHGALFAGPGLLPFRPYPLACPGEGAYGVAWYCTRAARFGAFYAPRGPFRGPWAAPIQPLSSGLPRGHMVLPGTALVQPILGLFTPHGALFAGPGLLPSSPYPLACPGGIWCCLVLRLHSPFWGFFTPTQGPFCMGGPPIPHPFGCLQLVRGFSFIPPKPIFRLGACPSHMLLLAIHQIFSC
ncbi:hypothetical protein B0H14DRAFT_2627873 [Mycena olivaceomarginata]|nr:hypothetical protein B0H14DRAFT_2627873 [Mycena olivaceomarginata]